MFDMEKILWIVQVKLDFTNNFLKGVAIDLLTLTIIEIIKWLGACCGHKQRENYM